MATWFGAAAGSAGCGGVPGAPDDVGPDAEAGVVDAAHDAEVCQAVADAASCPARCEGECDIGSECIAGECQRIPASCGPMATDVVAVGVDSADVRALDVMPGASDHVFAGTRSGVWESLDGGCTWSFAGLGGQEVTVVRADEAGRVWAGTFGAGLYLRSRAEGEFMRVTPRDEFLWVTDVEVDPFNDQIIFASGMHSEIIPWTNGGLYASRDGGASWVQVFDCDTMAERLAPCSIGRPAFIGGVALDADMPGRLWVAFEDTNGATSCGLWRSTDGGESWDPVETLDGFPVEDVVLVGGDSPRIVVSSGGALWTAPPDATSWDPITPAGVAVDAISRSADDCQYVVFASSLRAGAYGLLHDGEWRRLNLDSGAGPVLGLGALVYVGTRLGVYRSNDGGESFEMTSGGLDGVTLRDLAFGPTYTYAGTSAGLYRARAKGRSWRRIGVPDLPSGAEISAVLVDPVDERIVYAGIDNLADSPYSVAEESPVLFASHDAGDSFEAMANGLPTRFRVNALARLEDGDGGLFILIGKAFVSTNRPVYTSADPATGWVPLDGLPFILGVGAAILPGSPARAYVAGNAGIEDIPVVEVDASGEVLPVTVDGLPSLLGLTNAVAAGEDPWCLLLDQSTTWESDVGIYTLTTPAGPWSQHNDGLPALDGLVVSALLVHPGTGHRFAGLRTEVDRRAPAGFRAGYGVYRSRSEAEPWAELPLTLRGIDVTCLVPDPYCDDRLYVGTRGGGIELAYVGE